MKRRILFIEDHDDTRELVHFVLEASDYSVTTEATIAAGAALESDKLRALQAGAQAYLSKPCTFADLLRAVGVLITQAQQRIAVTAVQNLVA